jgi:hypothetical protein
MTSNSEWLTRFNALDNERKRLILNRLVGRNVCFFCNKHICCCARNGKQQASCPGATVDEKGEEFTTTHWSYSSFKKSHPSLDYPSMEVAPWRGIIVDLPTSLPKRGTPQRQAQEEWRSRVLEELLGLSPQTPKNSNDYFVMQFCLEIVYQEEQDKPGAGRRKADYWKQTISCCGCHMHRTSCYYDSQKKVVCINFDADPWVLPANRLQELPRGMKTKIRTVLDPPVPFRDIVDYQEEYILASTTKREREDLCAGPMVVKLFI